MKKFFLVLFLMVACHELFAQGGFRIGARGGVNGTLLLNSNIMSDDSSKYEIGVGGYGGLVLAYDAMFYNYGFYLDIMFKQYSHKILEDRPTPHWKSFTKLQYVSLPLTMRFRSAGDRYTRTYTNGGPYFEMGLAPEFLMSATTNYTFLDTSKNSNITTQTDAASNFQSMNLAAVIGFGFTHIGTEKWSVTHGLRFTFGILDAASSTGKASDMYILRGKTYKPYRTLTGGYMLSIVYKFAKGAGKKRK